MSKKTQGTMLYTIDPVDGAVIEVGCVISIDGIDSSIDQIETTCLSMTERTYVAGLATPGTANFVINTDPQDDSHVRLFELKQEGVVLPWAIGWSDGDNPPTSALNTNGDYEFVTTTERSWLLFEGFMNSFPFSFAQNAVVTSTIGIQVSGEQTLIPAAS